MNNLRKARFERLSLIVSLPSPNERRRHPRFPQVLEIEACGVPPLKHPKSYDFPVAGRAQNFSKGGFCLLTRQPVDSASLMLCHIGVSDGATTIPTLVQVRWTRKQNLEDSSYLSGLQFLF